MVYSIGMRSHCSPVDCCDQPVYALSKEAQFRYPNRFSNYFTIIGGLHIEHSLLIIHGKFIAGCGLSKILAQSSLKRGG